MVIAHCGYESAIDAESYKIFRNVAGDPAGRDVYGARVGVMRLQGPGRPAMNINVCAADNTHE